MPDDALYPRLKVAPLEVSLGLRSLACEAIKRAITEMDMYGRSGEIRLDERQLSQDLGVSPHADPRGAVGAGAGGLCPVGAAARDPSWCARPSAKWSK